MSILTKYRVENWINAKGFNVSLDRDFALKCLETDISERQAFFQDMAKKMVIKPIYSNKITQDPLFFVKDSLLVQRFRVPDDDCTLGFSYEQLKSIEKFNEPVYYYCHNVDTDRNKIALYSLFLHWYNIAENYL